MEDRGAPMKFKRYDNITDKFNIHSYWSHDTAFEVIERNTKDKTILVPLASLKKILDQGRPNDTMILSPDIAEIIRDTVSATDSVISPVPDHILAPVGAISKETVINVTREIQSQEMKRFDQTSNSQFGHMRNLHYLYRWQDEARDQIVRKMVLASTPTHDDEKANEHYTEGLVLSLSHMRSVQWDERSIYLFIALNQFMMESVNQGTTFKEFLDNQDSALEHEFYNFNGVDNPHTKTLVEKWSSNYPFIPQKNNSIKVMKALETVTQQELIKLLNSSPASNELFLNSASKQILTLEANLERMRNKEETVNGAVAADRIAEAFYAAQGETNVRSAPLACLFAHAVTLYQNQHVGQDMHSSVISKYLLDHADQFTRTDIAAITSAMVTPEIIMPSGQSFDAKYVVYMIIKRAKDPVSALQFIAETATDFDGSLPTKKMWLDLIERDNVSNEFVNSPNIVLLISGATSTRKWPVSAIEFRDALKRVRTNPAS